MSFVLGPNEDVAFKHSTVFDKVAGTLYLTNLRLSWIPEKPELPSLVFTMAEVLDDKYSPAKEPRAMLRLTVTTCSTPKVFTLTGTDASLCRKELERLNQLMKQVRSGIKPSALSSNISNIPSFTGVANNSNKRSRIQTTIDNQTEALRRSNLLQADNELKRQYNDLVRDSKLVTDEEFWETRKHLLAASEASKVSSNKGMLSKLFSDIQETDQNGDKKLTITAEIIDRIFLMYPAVQKAYSAKVPVELSEREFWTKYFQSEYFSRDKGVKDGDARGSNAPRTDDIFSRYEVESVDPSKGKRCRVSEALQHRDVDLTANYGDFHSAEHSAASDMPVNAVGTATAVLAKYMRNSNLVLPKPLQSNNIAPQNDVDNLAYSELMKEKPPSYIPLNLKTTVSRNGEDRVSLAGEGVTDEEGHGSNGIKASVSIGKASSAAEIKATLLLCFPTREASGRFLERQKKDLVALTASDVSSKGKAEVSLTDSEQLSDRFKQFMLEKFSSVTELLRHFYAMLNREGNLAPIEGSEAATKVDRILEKLSDYLEQLNKEKKSLQQSQQHAKALPAMFRCIYQLTQLIHRAVDVWDKYKDSQRLLVEGNACDDPSLSMNRSVFMSTQNDRNPFAKAY